MRKLRFNIDVKTKALLCPNPSEWFAKSYIQENVVDNFFAIPGVKDATKVSKNKFENLIQSAGCSWSATDTVLDAEDVDVCKFDVMVQVCQYDLESSFVSAQMSKGDMNWTEASFLAHFWEELSEAIAEELQLIRWNGDTNISNSFLGECDGYIKQLASAEKAKQWLGNGTIDGTTQISKDNIIDILAGVIASLPDGVKSKKKDVRIYMSDTNALYYQLATLGLNANFNYTGELDLQFAGYKIAVQSGMPDNYIVAASKNSMVYAFDGEGDEKELNIVNLRETTAEPILRVRVGFKAGFTILDKGSEVAYFVGNGASSI